MYFSKYISIFNLVILLSIYYTNFLIAFIWQVLDTFLKLRQCKLHCVCHVGWDYQIWRRYCQKNIHCTCCQSSKQSIDYNYFLYTLKKFSRICLLCFGYVLSLPVFQSILWSLYEKWFHEFFIIFFQLMKPPHYGNYSNSP